MSGQNEVIKKGDVVIKRYGSHLNYLKESSIYAKLKGSGLAPRVLFEGEDSIEHEYVSGPGLNDLLAESMDDPAKLAACFKLFFDWYAAFRAKTQSCLGKADFGKFIYADGSLKCVDFEHCKAGYAEWDVAALAARVCLMGEPLSFRSLEICRLFISVGAGAIAWDPSRLVSCLEKELSDRCQAENVDAHVPSFRYLLSAVSSCGVLFAEDPLADVTAAMPFISTSPQRIIVCSEEGKPECPSFSCLEAGAGKVGTLLTASRLMKEVKQPLSLWLNASEKYTRESILGLLSADMSGLDAVIASSEGSGRIFPMLIRTETARVAFSMAVSGGMTTLPEALKMLRVKYL